MIITLVSSYLNHHQLLFCNALRERCDEFYYISTGRISRARLRLGYKELDYEYDFVTRTYDGSATKEQVYDILAKSDAVIFGSCPNSFIEYRIKLDKLSFLFSERFFKKGVWRRFYPPTKEKVMSRIVRFKDRNIYVLCASAFLAWDLSLLGYPADKCYKWGYFPMVDLLEEYPERKNERVRILWVGRMLRLKRADTALKACRALFKSGVDFKLYFIGDGECSEELKALSDRYGLGEKVSFLGSMPPEEVRKAMLESDIFLFTSDFREGWGAVLNEAMSCGCAVLASSAIGSVPFLIEDGKNGLIYKFGSQKDFDRKLKILASDKEKRRALGKNAIDTLKNLYSADVAAERLVEFIKGNGAEYTEGPMSRAEIIKNKWYK